MTDGARRIAAPVNTLSLESVGSTNDLARRLVGLWRRERPFPGLVVTAGEQTAGRGRRGRGWSSPAGRGAYLSVVRALPAKGVVALPLLAGAAVCDVLARVCGLEAGLEWPNDVLVDGRKIAGVLVEVVGGGGPAQVAILGLGVNVTHRREDLPRIDATSVSLETGAEPPVAELAAQLVVAIDRELRRGRRPGYAVERFAELTVHRLGDELSLRVGDRVERGLFDGLEPSGALRLRVGAETRVVHDGVRSHDEEDPSC